MDLLCFFSVLCLLCINARLFICALWSPAGKRLTFWLSFVVSNCGILRQVWYLILSIPDLCTLTYFGAKNTRFHDFVNDELLLKVFCYVVSLFNRRESNANFKHIRAI